jgi:hypothetical protein
MSRLIKKAGHAPEEPDVTAEMEEPDVTAEPETDIATDA